MKVLHICTMDRGGAFHAAYNLHLGLLNEGVNSKMLILKRSNNNLKKVIYFLDNRSAYQKITDSISYRIYKWRKKNWTKVKSKCIYSVPFSPYDILRHPLVRSSDIIHLHWISDFLDYPTFFNKVNKVVFWTLHDKNPFSGGFHFSSYEEPTMMDKDNNIITIKRKALSKAININVVSPSKWLFNESKQSKVLGAFDHYLIRYGLNTDLFQARDRIKSRDLIKLPQNKKIILFVSDSISDRRKGLTYLMKALSFNVGEEILLLTVGSKTFVSNEGNVISLGFIEDQEVLSHVYSAADVFVIPSIEDNLPNTVLESLACGTPVVGFKVGGIPDMVYHQFNGYLADEVSSEALSKGTKYVLDHLPLYKRSEIRNDCVSRFSLQQQALKYIELYKSKYKEFSK